MNPLALIESKTLRESVIERTDVLDKVKKLMLLPDDLHVTVDMAANYYEVESDTIRQVLSRHKKEFESDGVQTITSKDKGYDMLSQALNPNQHIAKIIPRRAILRMGMLLRDSLVAQTVRTMLLDVEQSQVRESEDTLQFRKEILFLEATGNILRLPESGKLKLMGDFARTHCLNVPLPAYAVNEEITESATALLKKHGVPMGAAKFNTLLIQHGLLEEMPRPSSKGGTKWFKSLTETGLQYGKNMISPHNSRETQPHYYATKFDKLLKLISA